MTTNTKAEYPGAASALAIAGGALMVVSSLLILAVSFIFLPSIGDFIGQNSHFITNGNVTTAIINNRTYTFTGPYHGINGSFPFPASAIPSFASRILGFVGGLGLVSGIIVLLSGLMLHYSPTQRTLWGVLVIVFSVLSFFGAGGFLLGALLGIIGGAMALTWRPREGPPAGGAATATTTTAPVA